MAEIKNGDLDRATDPEYAAVSTTAVLGLLLSMLGLAALWKIPFLAAPVLGLALSIIALRKIRRSSGVLVGGRLALAGIVIATATIVTAAGYHTRAMLREHRTLHDLQVRASAITDDLLADRYDAVYQRLSADSPQRLIPITQFKAAFAGLFEGAGKVTRKKLMSLQLLLSDKGETVAPADIEVELEHRILTLTIWFCQNAAGTWDFYGIGGEETMESLVKFSSNQGPRSVPGPFQRSYEHHHH